jgi:hypothetical protein
VPRHREGVELETAFAVYATTAGVTALATPLAAWALDERDEFPLFATLGISIASGFGGWLIASLASVPLNDVNGCGLSELYPERVALLDLVPLSLAGAPTLIAWSLSDASTQPVSPRARLSIGALADPRDHVLVVARLEL